jgi:hypothetical protein
VNAAGIPFRVESERNRAEEERHKRPEERERSGTSLAEDVDEDVDKPGRTELTSDTGEASPTGNVGQSDYGPGRRTGKK